MRYRQLGTTGIEVSVVGLGSEHLDNKPQSVADEVIGAALDCGVNIMDLFMPGRPVRENIGRALKGRRDRMLIQGHIGSVDLREQYDVSRELDVCKRYFEQLLQALQTDWIDFGMLFFLDKQEEIDQILENGVVDYARKLKKDGVIRAVGASAHNPAAARRLVEEGIVDMMMFSINPAFDMMPGNADILNMLNDDPLSGKVTRIDPERAALYRLCESRGVGLTVMKPLGAGKLVSAEHTPFARPLTPHQCIHYALTRPAVAAALVGCASAAEVAAAASYADLAEDDPTLDYSGAVAAFKEGGKGGFAGSCVYCNHCRPCPSDIDIAAVNKYLDIARLHETPPPGAAQHYRALERHGSDCVACGSCEERCPFGVAVSANMAEAARVFGM